MSKHDRGVFFAIGLVVGIAIAFVFFVWSVPGFRNPPYQPVGYSNTENPETGDYKPIVGSSFWEIYTSPSDSYAQWIMAVFSIAATGVSIWAVRLLRDTLIATRAAVRAADDTVNVTREIGKAQTRAYLSVTPNEIPPLEGSNLETAQNFTISINNGGQSPAKNLRYNAIAEWGRRDITNSDSDLIDESGKFKNPRLIISAGGTEEIIVDSNITLNDFYMRETDGYKEGPILYGIIWYEDVFGDEHKFRFFYTIQTRAIITKIPDIGDEVGVCLRFFTSKTHNDEN